MVPNKWIVRELGIIEDVLMEKSSPFQKVLSGSANCLVVSLALCLYFFPISDQERTHGQSLRFGFISPWE